MSMTSVPAFLDRCARYAERRGISEARLSTLILNDGKRLRLLREQTAGITVRRLDTASQTLAKLEAA